MPKLHRVSLVACAVVYAAFASGCVSYGSAQKADTLGKGNLQVGIEPGATGILLPATPATPATFGVLPTFNGSLRYGLSDTADLGVRVGTTLIELSGKFLLTDPSNEALAISLVPSVMGAYIGIGGSGASASFGTANIQIPALIGIKFGQGSELVIGPRLNNALYFGGASGGGSGGSGVVYELLVGGSVGAAFQLTDFFGLMPEFSAMVPVVTTVATNTGSASASGPGVGPRFGFSLNFLLGRGRSAKPDSSDVPPPPPPPPAPAPSPAAP